VLELFLKWAQGVSSFLTDLPKNAMREAR